MANNTATVATAKKPSIYRRLMDIRKDFLEVSIKKSGMNPHAQFTYYELSDIVPNAIDILSKHNCIFTVNFNVAEGTVIGTLMDVDTAEKLDFTAPFLMIAEPAKFRMNEIQGCGSAITYYRRYLYMMMLDLVEHDEIDGGLGAKPEKPKTEAAPQKPATPATREAIKEKLTSELDPFMVEQIHKLLDKMVALDPTQEEFRKTVLTKSKDLTEISKEDAETLLTGLSNAIKQYEVKQNG